MSVRVQREIFDVGYEIAALSRNRADIGAIVSFTGLVRDRSDMAEAKSELEALDLEHYPGMTEKALERLETEARERWPLKDLTIIHRYGRLHRADPIVFVGTASAHRAVAFESAAFLMDYLKTSAPFWKRAIGADGLGEWVDARESDNQAAARWL